MEPLVYIFEVLRKTLIFALNKKNRRFYGNIE